MSQFSEVQLKHSEMLRLAERTDVRADSVSVEAAKKEDTGVDASYLWKRVSDMRDMSRIYRNKAAELERQHPDLLTPEQGGLDHE